jgi:signal transduction histidine kinase
MKTGFYTGRWSIFYRLNSKMTAAIVLCLVAVLGSSTFFMEKVQRENALLKAKEWGSFITSTIMVSLEYHMLKNDRPAIARYLESLNNSEEIKSASIIRDDGRIVFSTNSTSVGLKISPAFLARSIRSGENQSMNLGFRSDERILSVITDIPNRKECRGCHSSATNSLGIMIVDISMKSTENLIVQNRNRLILSSCIAIIAVSVMLFLLNNRFIYAPVKKLTRVIEGVRKGDLTIREDYPIRDELGHLGDSLNTMIESLDEANNKLRESYKRQLYQSEKLSAIGLLTSGIIHEIQNPFIGIHNSLKVIYDEMRDQETREILSQIMSEMNKPMRMARELLGFVKPSEQKTEYADLNELVEGALFFIGKQAEKQQVSIRKEFSDRLPKIRVDADAIKQVFMNLIINAVQAMPGGGEILISTGISANGEDLRVSVEDNGPGIASADIEKLFKPFFSTKKGGTGLGLYMSKGIINSHGGEISVETLQGRGSKFTIKFRMSKILVHS